jgi:hypothetical protein
MQGRDGSASREEVMDDHEVEASESSNDAVSARDRAIGKA